MNMRFKCPNCGNIHSERTSSVHYSCGIDEVSYWCEKCKKYVQNYYFLGAKLPEVGCTYEHETKERMKLFSEILTKAKSLSHEMKKIILKKWKLGGKK